MTDHREAPAPTLEDATCEAARIIHAECFTSPDDDSRCERAAAMVVSLVARALAERAEPDGALREALELIANYTPRSHYEVEDESQYLKEVARRALASAPQRAGTDGEKRDAE